MIKEDNCEIQYIRLIRSHDVLVRDQSGMYYKMWSAQAQYYDVETAASDDILRTLKLRDSEK